MVTLIFADTKDNKRLTEKAIRSALSAKRHRQRFPLRFSNFSYLRDGYEMAF